eukprot:5500132-Amphidinium_carterae.2
MVVLQLGGTSTGLHYSMVEATAIPWHRVPSGVAPLSGVVVGESQQGSNMSLRAQLHQATFNVTPASIRDPGAVNVHLAPTARPTSSSSVVVYIAPGARCTSRATHCPRHVAWASPHRRALPVFLGRGTHCRCGGVFWTQTWFGLRCDQTDATPHEASQNTLGRHLHHF